MDHLEMDRKFTARSVNEGFSGGEKKRNEILQMMMLEPKYSILDETDSGLDIDALKIVAKGVNAMRSPERGMLLITHYQRLLDYIAPDHVHVIHAGRQDRPHRRSRTRARTRKAKRLRFPQGRLRTRTPRLTPVSPTASRAGLSSTDSSFDDEVTADLFIKTAGDLTAHCSLGTFSHPMSYDASSTIDADTREAIDIDRSKGDFHFPERHKFDAGRGLDRAHRRLHQRGQGRAAVGPRVPPQGSQGVPREADAHQLGDQGPGQHRLRRHPLLPLRRREAEALLGRGPPDVLETFERLGIPQQERAFLAGVEAQYDSEASYSNMKEELTKLGVIFVNSNEGLRSIEAIFRKWFGKVIPTGDNKFSALNSAVFSGGSFIYIPKGVKLKQPLQAYFRINSENFGQFERTLIIADEGAEVMYMEGCTAPKFETATLHSAVVELVALKGAKIQYVTVQNWSSNVFNLVTKRGLAMEDAEVRWIDCNIGSRLTMKYPGVIMKGERARGEVISIALANSGQHQDTGAKMIHAANNTTSNVVSKSISVGQGRSTYRGQVHIPKHLKGCKNNTECDALLINTSSRTDTYPAITVKGNQHATQHEASVSQVSEEMLFYMQQRGLSEGQAMSLAVNGFINDLVREFPMEYSVELKRLIDLEMEGSCRLIPRHF
jgi:Fe-S cluster assembly protein SufB